MAVQNKFEVLRQAEEVDQQWAKFKVPITEAAEEQIPRVERKTKQRWMTENILDFMEKKRQIKKYETLHKKSEKK